MLSPESLKQDIVDPSSQVESPQGVTDEWGASDYDADRAVIMDELVIRINKNIRSALDRTKRHRSQKRRDFDFYASHQWEEETEQELKAQGRAPVAFNRICKVVNVVTGMEVQNRQSVTFLPIGIPDSGLADLSNEAVDWARKGCDAEDEESEAFRDVIICGEGWTETSVDYTEDPDGMYKKERRDPLEMGVDPRSIKANYDDARFMFHVKAYTTEEFEELWPETDVRPAKFAWYDGLDVADEPHYQPKDYPSVGESSEERLEQDVFEVYKYQEYQLEHYYRVFDPQGNVIQEVAEGELEAVKEYLDMMGLKYLRQQRKIYKQYLLCGGTLLNEPDSNDKDAFGAPVNGFTFRAMTGLRDRNKREWFGLVRLMREPQMWANKWLIQIQHIINTSAKGGKLLHETGAFARPQDVNDSWAIPGESLELNAGGLQKYKVEMGAPYPDGVDRLLQYALQAIDDVPGVNTAVLGNTKGENSGYLEAQRKQAGITILASFFDSKRRYSKESGRIDIMFIQKYMSDGRLIKIDGDNGNAQFIPLLRNNVDFKYHIEVDEAPTSANMKDKTFSILLSLLPTIKEMGVAMPPSMLDYLPLNSKLIKDWKQYIQEQSESPDAQQAKELAKQRSVLELESLQLDNAVKQFGINTGLPSKSLSDQSVAALNTAKAEATGQGNIADNIINARIAEINATAQITKARAEVIKANAGVQSDAIKARTTHMKNIADLTKQAREQNGRQSE